MRSWIPLGAALALQACQTEAPVVLGPADGLDLGGIELERVAVGDPAPLFTLDSYHGEPISLAGYQGEKNVVLVFYRGHW